MPLVVALLDHGPAWDTLVRRPAIWLEIGLPGGVGRIDSRAGERDHKCAARAVTDTTHSLEIRIAILL